MPRSPTWSAFVLAAMVLTATVDARPKFEAVLKSTEVAIDEKVVVTITASWEERGGKEAGLQALGTLVVAVLAFWVMNINQVRHFVFVFPESLLIVLAAILLLGRYSGYRLVELPRFRVLAEPKP